MQYISKNFLDPLSNKFKRSKKFTEFFNYNKM